MMRAALKRLQGIEGLLEGFTVVLIPLYVAAWIALTIMGLFRIMPIPALVVAIYWHSAEAICPPLLVALGGYRAVRETVLSRRTALEDLEDQNKKDESLEAFQRHGGRSAGRDHIRGV